MVIVVGALAIDLVAVRERFLDGTSNPSDIRMGLGGVGYRVFSNLEVPRRFITALGADPISRWARDALEGDGDVVIQQVATGEAGPPLYLALMESGNLKVAASDFRIVEESLSPAFVDAHVGEPGPGDFLVLDANLSPQLLERLVHRHALKTHLVFEPVSVEKARRHAASLRGIFLMTPTEEEIEALAPGDVTAFMAERQIEAVLVTRGEKGACLYAHGERMELPPARVIESRDTSGAGDLLLASLLSRLHEGADLAAAVVSAMRSVEKRLLEGGA
jgi:sugar/nucleoside kinase (ribokinase family)